MDVAWTAAWRQDGVAGLAEGDHGGQVDLGSMAEELLADLLATEVHAQVHRATGWTEPLMRTELDRRGTRVSERTIRRTLHLRGYLRKRPRSPRSSTSRLRGKKGA